MTDWENEFRATVTDAGGGYVTLFVDRNTLRYPKVGSKVTVAYEKKTPEEWAEEKGIVVVDPDGWSMQGAPSWETPISEAEFDRRAFESTIASRKEDGSW